MNNPAEKKKSWFFPIEGFFGLGKIGFFKSRTWFLSGAREKPKFLPGNETKSTSVAGETAQKKPKLLLSVLSLNREKPGFFGGSLGAFSVFLGPLSIKKGLRPFFYLERTSKNLETASFTPRKPLISTQISKRGFDHRVD